jgi:hypothetical protein
LAQQAAMFFPTFKIPTDDEIRARAAEIVSESLVEGK